MGVSMRTGIIILIVEAVLLVLFQGIIFGAKYHNSQVEKVDRENNVSPANYCVWAGHLDRCQDI